MNSSAAYHSRFLNSVSAICALLVVLVALVGLMGWIWDIQVLKSIHSNYVSLKPNTVICFLLSGSALYLLTSSNKGVLRLASMLLLLSTSIAGIVLVEYIFDVDAGIDQLLFKDTMEEGYFSPGRMPLTSAVCFLLLGTGAWLRTRGERSLQLAQLFFMLAFLTAYAVLLSYFYGLKGFIGGDNYSQMALRAAANFMLLSLGFVFLPPRAGYFKLLSSEYAGGLLLRKFLLCILLLPIVAGSLIIWGLRLNGYSMEFAMALFALVSMVLLLLIMFTSFGQLRREELLRNKQALELVEVNKELAVSEEELQVTVEELTSLNEELHTLNDQLEEARRETARLATEALQESQYQYKELADSITDPVLIVDKDFRYLYINQAVERITGKKAEEVLGKTPEEVYGEAVAEQFHERKKAIKRVAASGDKEVLIDTIAHGAVHKMLEISLYPTKSGHVLIITRDVSERIKAEQQLLAQQEELRESEERYRRLFESNKDPLFLADRETLEIKDVNHAACQIYGYSKEDLLQLKITDISAEPENTKKALQEEVSTVLLHYHRTKEGTTFPVELAFNYLRLADRSMSIVAARDITERLEITRKLEEEKQRLELAIGAANFGMYDWHIQAKRTSLNKRYWKMLDITPKNEQETYAIWENSLHPEDKAKVHNELQRHLSGETNIFKAEYRIRHRSGKWFWVIDSGKIISWDKEGKPERMVGILLDITDAKEAELEIRKLATVAQKTDNAVIITDAAGYIEWVNEGFTQICGYTFEEVVGKKPGELLQGPDTDPEAVDALRQAIARQESVAVEILNYTKDKRPYWLAISLQPVFDEKGELRQFIALERDITARKEAEAQLHFQATVLQNVKDAVLVTDLQGHTKYYNQGAEAIFGYKAEEMLGQSPLLIYSQEINPDWDKRFELMLQGVDYAGEWRGTRNDGTPFWAYTVTSLLRDPKGNTLGLLAVSRDITDRKIAEEQLVNSEANLRAIFDASIQSYFLLDSSYRILKYNRTGEQFIKLNLGRQVQEGDSMLRYSDPNALEDFKQHVDEAFTGVRIMVTRQLTHPNIGTFWVEVQYQPVFNNRDEIYAVAMVALDITERKKQEQAILDLNASLEHKVEARTVALHALNKELEAFSYSVSHDLRAPLRSIDGFSKVLMSEYEQVLGEEGNDYLATIRMATQRMGHLIDDLLKLSRVSRGQLTRTAVDVTQMANDILEELQRENRDREVNISVAPGLAAKADARLLQIALKNLLSNAWKYTARREEATIEVGKTTTEKGEAYYVKDNGAGFDMRYAEKLFGAFQRMHSSKEFEGTGIGLAIVQRIIVKHGGEIWAEASPNVGATFYFTLPDLPGNLALVEEI